MLMANQNYFVVGLEQHKNNNEFRKLEDGSWVSQPGGFSIGADSSITLLAALGFSTSTGHYRSALRLETVNGVAIAETGVAYTLLDGRLSVVRNEDDSFTLNTNGASQSELAALQFGYEDVVVYSEEHNTHSVLVDTARSAQDQSFVIATLNPGEVFSARSLTQQGAVTGDGSFAALGAESALVVSGRGTFTLEGNDVVYRPSHLPNNQSQSKVEFEVTRDGAVVETALIEADKVENEFNLNFDNSRPEVSESDSANVFLHAGQTVTLASLDLIGVASDAENDALSLENLSFTGASGVTFQEVSGGQSIEIDAAQSAPSQLVSLSYRLNDGALNSPMGSGAVSVSSGYAGTRVTSEIELTVLPSHQTKVSGDWFDPVTWGGAAGEYGIIPSDAALVHIAQHMTVDYDLGSAHYAAFVNHWQTAHSQGLDDLPPSVEAYFGAGGSEAPYLPSLFIVRVDGTLNVTAENGAETGMVVDTLYSGMSHGAHGSTINIDAADVSDGSIDIAISPLDMSVHQPVLPEFYAEAGDYDDGTGVLGRYQWDPEQISLGLIASGTVNIAGQQKAHALKLEADLAVGATVIDFGQDLEAAGWAVGDIIVIPTTARHQDFRDANYEHQNEVIRIDAFTNGGEGIRFTRVEDDTNSLKFDHSYDIYAPSNQTPEGVSIPEFLEGNYEDRAQDFELTVINLSRNVTIRSSAATEEFDDLGIIAHGESYGTRDIGDSHWVTEQGHVMLYHTASADISNAEFLGLGRTDKAIPLNDVAITGKGQNQSENPVLMDVKLLAEIIGILNAADDNWEINHNSRSDMASFINNAAIGGGTPLRYEIDALANVSGGSVSSHFLDAVEDNLAKAFAKQEFNFNFDVAVEDLINPRGRYSLHIHRAGTEEGAEKAHLEGNVVWGSPGWGFTQHDSVADLINNVSFDVRGSAFNTETGNERGLWDGNVAVQTTYPRVWASQNREDDFSAAIHDFGFSGSGYWLEGHAVGLENNVAIDSATAGFWIATNGALSQSFSIDELGDVPDGLEQLVDENGHLEAEEVPFLNFRDNSSVSTNYAIYWQGDNQLSQPQSVRLESDIQHVIEDFTSIGSEQYLLYAFGVANVKLIDPLGYGGKIETFTDPDADVLPSTTLINSQHKSSDFTVIGGRGWNAGQFFSHSGDVKGAEDYGHVIVVRAGDAEPNVQSRYRGDLEASLAASGNLSGREGSVVLSDRDVVTIHYDRQSGSDLTIAGEGSYAKAGGGNVNYDLDFDEYQAVMPVLVLQESELSSDFRVVLGTQSSEAAYTLEGGSYSAAAGTGNTAYGFEFEDFAAGKIRNFIGLNEKGAQDIVEAQLSGEAFDITRISFTLGDGSRLTHRELMEDAALKYEELISRIKAVGEERYVFGFDPANDAALTLYGMVSDSFGATYTDFMGSADGDSTSLGYQIEDHVLASAAEQNGYFTIEGGMDAGTYFLVEDTFYDRYSGAGHSLAFAVKLTGNTQQNEAFLAGSHWLGSFDSLGFDSATGNGPLEDNLDAVAGSAVIANFGDDTLTGSDQADLLAGGDGDDLILSAGGADHLWGGYGADRFVLTGDGARVVIHDFSPGEDQVDASDFGIASFAALTLTELAEGRLEASGNGHFVELRGDWALGQSDVVRAENFLLGGSNGIVEGSDGNDLINAEYEDVDGDVLSASGSVVEAGAGRDRVVDLAGDDIIHGEAGNDRFDTRGGADHFYGGSGSDQVRYTYSSIGLTIDLRDTTQSTGFAADDIYTSIETIMASNHDDLIYSDKTSFVRGANGDDIFYDDAGSQRFRGDAGDDIYVYAPDGGARDYILQFVQGQDQIDLSAFGVTTFEDLRYWQRSSSSDVILSFGGDTLQVKKMWNIAASDTRLTGEDFIFAVPDLPQIDGAGGADKISVGYVDGDGHTLTHGGHTIIGLNGKDEITGGDGDDVIDGGTGNDKFYASGGSDSYFGGTGQDQLLYKGSSEAVVIDMVDQSNNAGAALGDRFESIERITGTRHDDSITAAAGARILASHGDDLLVDNSTGAERLHGGGGEDIFLLFADGFQDRIEDFQQGVDVIDISSWNVTFQALGFSRQSSNNQNTIISAGDEEIRVDGTWNDGAHGFTQDHFVF